MAFGPTPRSHRQRMPKRMRRQAIRVALSGKAAAERLFVVEGLDGIEPKTRAMAETLAAFGVTGSALIVTGGESQAVLAARNIPRVKTIRADLLNTLDLLRFDAALISPEAARRADEIWSDERRVRKAEAA